MKTRVMLTTTLALLLAMTAGWAQEAPAFRIATVDMGQVTEKFTALQERSQQLETWYQRQDLQLRELEYFLFLSTENFSEAMELVQAATELPDAQKQRLAALKELGAAKEREFEQLRSKPDRTAQEDDTYKGLEDLGSANSQRLAQRRIEVEREYRQRLTQARQELMAQVVEAVKAVAEEGGYHAALDSSVVLWGGEDITTPVLARLNQGGSG